MDDRHTFGLLFDAHRDVVQAVLVGRTGDRERARDLVQETFLRAWQRLPELRALPAGRQRGWLVTVARNLAVDERRADVTRAATGVALAGDAATRHDHDPRISADHLDAREDLGRLGAAIAELAEEDRVLLSLATVGGLPSHEIAESLGLAPGTVRSRLHRIRGRLAGHLQRETSR